jgi:hypothetical protein
MCVLEIGKEGPGNHEENDQPRSYVTVVSQE